MKILFLIIISIGIAFSLMGIECNTDGAPTIYPGGIVGIWRGTEGIATNNSTETCSDCSTYEINYTRNPEIIQFTSNNILRFYQDYLTLTNPGCDLYPDSAGIYYCSKAGTNDNSDTYYSTSENTLNLAIGEETMTFTFSINKDTLTLNNGEETILFERISPTEISSASEFCEPLPLACK
ncbi:hypothetical protein ACFL20_01260 [Spirochaetota bacterium]